MATPKIFRTWWAPRIFDLLGHLKKKKIQYQVLHLEIQLILSILWVWYLRMLAGKLLEQSGN